MKIREILEKLAKASEDNNPVDIIERNTLIFQGEQKIKALFDEGEVYKVIQLNSGEASPNSPFGWRKYIAKKLKQWWDKK